MNDLGRLLTAMITPYDASGAVDAAEAGRIAVWLCEQGNDGVVVCGTTGETPALETDEKLALFKATKAALGERGSVVAGTTGNNTHHSVELTKAATQLGVDGILAVVPYYSKPTQDGMLEHFGQIAEATHLPVVIYNIPGRTGTNLLPATLVELARRHKNVVGVKESSGDIAQFTEILRTRPAGFRLWSGDDYMFLPGLAVGADGLVSVAAHLAARELRQLMEAFMAGNVAEAARLHQQLAPLWQTLFATTSPIPVKWAMNQIGFSAGPCRSPLGSLPDEVRARLEKLLPAYRDRGPQPAAT